MSGSFPISGKVLSQLVFSPPVRRFYLWGVVLCELKTSSMDASYFGVD